MFVRRDARHGERLRGDVRGRRGLHEGIVGCLGAREGLAAHGDQDVRAGGARREGADGGARKGDRVGGDHADQGAGRTEERGRGRLVMTACSAP